MGLTVLAWGNSVGDCISNVFMARKGYAGMAISASYAAPLTSILLYTLLMIDIMLGMGIPLLVSCISSGAAYDIQISKLSNVIFFSFCSLAAVLLISLVVVPITKFRLRRPFGIVLIALYIIFTVFAVLLELNVLLGDVNLWLVI